MNKDILIKIIETIEQKHKKEMEEKNEILKRFGIEKYIICSKISSKNSTCYKCSFSCCDNCSGNFFSLTRNFNLICTECLISNWEK